MLMAALFEPFPLWLAAWETPLLTGIPLVSVSKGRVVHASKTAKQMGITAGSSLATALTKAPDLEAVEAASPYLDASWERLVEEISGITLDLETPKQGRVLMVLEPTDATQLAESYNVRVGLAETVEVAVAAALITSPGKVRRIDADYQDALLDALPLYMLRGLGLSASTSERLKWLGVERVGQLRAWKKPQVSAYLGAEAKELMPYLFGPYRTSLGRYVPAPYLSAQFTFDEPMTEPYALYPVLEALAAQAIEKLEGRAASRLTVRAVSQGLELKATRLSKTPLRQIGETIRLALLALDDTYAQPLGIDTLTLELSGLTRPAKQGTLWPQKERIEQAVAAVGARYPKALLRVAEADPYALASEHTVHVVVRSTGEEVSREAAAPDNKCANQPAGSPLRA